MGDDVGEVRGLEYVRIREVLLLGLNFVMGVMVCWKRES